MHQEGPDVDFGSILVSRSISRRGFSIDFGLCFQASRSDFKLILATGERRLQRCDGATMCKITAICLCPTTCFYSASCPCWARRSVVAIPHVLPIAAVLRLAANCLAAEISATSKCIPWLLLHLSTDAPQDTSVHRNDLMAGNGSTRCRLVDRARTSE